MRANDSATCPVCDEFLSARSAKCFRCDTKLEDWWPLEAVLVTGRPRSRYLWGFFAVVLGIVMGTCGQIVWWMELASVVTPPVASVVEGRSGVDNDDLRPPVAAFIQYRVQKGDSLWRVAAALTGRGDNWDELWPEYRGRERSLIPGSVLEVPTWRLAVEEW